MTTLGEISVFLFFKSSREGLSNSGVYDSNNTLQTVYTIDDKGQHTVSSSDFDHYTDSKSKFEVFWPKIMTIFQVCISWMQNLKDHLIEAEYVRIKTKNITKKTDMNCQKTPSISIFKERIRQLLCGHLLH